MSPEWTSSMSAWGPAAAAATLGFTRWFGAHRRNRRLRRFGDAAVLGIAGSFPRTFTSIVLFAVGGWSIGALLFPARTPITAVGPPSVVFCIDHEALRAGVGSLRMRDGRALQLLEAVSAVGKGLGGVLVGALVPTGTGVKCIGTSQDAEGVAMRLRSLWPEISGAAATAESQVDLWLSGRAEKPRSAQALCLLTFRSVAELPQPEAAAPGGPQLYMVRLGEDFGKRTYLAASQTEDWIEVQDLHSFCAAISSGLTPAPDADTTRKGGLLSAVAFAALAAEWTLEIVNCRRRRPHASVHRAAVAAGLGVLLVMPAPLSAAGLRRVSEVAPGVAVITEISEEQPWVGEQFGIVYLLQLTVPVRAVDIDPQSFTGLWTQPVAAPDDGGSGQSGSSGFLLRQVVAWPLRDGSIQLPPLRVRIQTAHSSTWDLVGTSDPITVTARRVPPDDGFAGSFPLVGSLDGKMEPLGAGSAEWVLELEGSSLVAVLDPEHWLTKATGKPVVVSPIENDDTTQQIVDGGRRSVSVLQRRRWLADAADGGRLDFSRPLELRVFETTRARWEQVRVRVAAHNPGLESERKPYVGGLRRDPSAGGKRWWTGSGRTLLALGSLAALALGARALSRRRRTNSTVVERG